MIVPNYFVTRFLKGNVTNHEKGIGDYEAFKQFVEKKQPLNETVEEVGRIHICWKNTSDETRVPRMENTTIICELSSSPKHDVDSTPYESPYVWKNEASYISLSCVNIVTIAIILILKLDI